MILSAGQIADISTLIGAPYDKENRAPGFHCWGCFCEVQRILGRINLPDFVPAMHTTNERARALAGHPERARWQEINEPLSGCAVLMGRNKVPVHIGCFLDIDRGGVIHATEGAGVVFDTFQLLKQKNWRCITYLLPA